MGVEALTTDLARNRAIPTTSEAWSDWVSASATRNHVIDDPLLDWLDRFGEAKGYRQDEVDPRTDFRTFIFRKGAEFEAAVVDHLRTLVEVHTPEGAGGGYEARRDLSVAEATFAAMREGYPVIFQGVLRDAESRTYGSPDLLIRSDILTGLFPGVMSEEHAAVPSPDIGSGAWHYCVVDTKFTTLTLAAGGELDNSGSHPAYKVQVWLYNRMLGRLQGYTPSDSYLLGRGWEQKRQGETTRVHNAFDRLAPVAQDYASRGRGRLEDQAEAAIAWLRRMRREGHGWVAEPEPTIDELRVNAKGAHAPWQGAVSAILAETQDLTQLYQVGAGKRRDANAQGLHRWTDPRVTASSVGVTGQTYGPRLDALLAVNRDELGPAVRPRRVSVARDEWFEPPQLELYVDFETVSSLDDDFTRIPHRGGQELIFMLGCGHIEDGEWRYESFIADDLTVPAEARAIDAWVEHMQVVRDRLAPELDPRVIHWSPAEETWLETAWYAAVKRHPEKDWPHPNWFDFLNRVVRAEPVVVRGAHGFGLKQVAKAMHELGLIETEWGEGPTDGLGAMIGAWWCDAEARLLGCRLADLELMQQVAAYNEVDCRAMLEIVGYLRAAH